MDYSSLSPSAAVVTPFLPTPNLHHPRHPAPSLPSPWIGARRSFPPRTPISTSPNPKKPYSPPKPTPSLLRYALAQEMPTPPLTPPPSEKLRRLASEFRSLPQSLDRVKRLLDYASRLPPLPEEERTTGNRVMGCTAQVWVTAAMDADGRVCFGADSDSEITKGFCACLLGVLDGAAPEEVLEVGMDDLEELNVVGVGGGRASSRVNTWYNVLMSLQKRTKALVAEREGQSPAEPFPSLVIEEDGIRPLGSFAEAQATYLSPDELKIKELVQVLKDKKIGVVAHFYMDPEVQGVLTAAQKHWPHIHISDSLVMADSAVKMAEAGCQYITVLGVDFMSENVRAILDLAGFEKVGVYRMSDEMIGCSLADAAASPAYMNFLASASMAPPSLHVIYINTSLETKAKGHELVPTITCTSSNVVQTILQAFAQIRGLNVWYGPDSYMGANIVELFRQMASMTNEEIAQVHPEHDRDSIISLLSRLQYFRDGSCVVHHLFGHEVVEKIRELYCDAFLTAHFEVPGEMFSLAIEAKRRGMGVVGSTKNILDFIKERVREALDRNIDDHLQFVLGTESGMITSIVAAVCNLLNSDPSSSRKLRVSVEVVFPVSSDSMSTTSADGVNSIGATELAALTIVPGVSSGEGCSIHGGCASCPYMKMNSLTSLLNVCHQLPDEDNKLWSFEARRFNKATALGRSVAEVGCEPILHMRHFQATGKLPERLVSQVLDLSRKGESVTHLGKSNLGI